MAIQPPKHVMDLLLDAICVVDRQGRFLSISGACEAIFGYRPEEMVGRSMLDFLYAEDLDRTLQAVARIEAGYQQRHFENRYVRKDGSLATIEWSARLSECKTHRVAVARDISARQQALPDEALQAAPADVPAAWRLSAAPPALTPPGCAPVPLSAQDYTVLRALADGAHGAQYVTRRSIVKALGEDYLHYDQRRLDTQMHRLRRKIEQASGQRLPIATVRGQGYRVYRRIEVEG